MAYKRRRRDCSASRHDIVNQDDLAALHTGVTDEALVAVGPSPRPTEPMMASPRLGVAQPGTDFCIWMYRMPESLSQEPSVIEASPDLPVPLRWNRDE